MYVGFVGISYVGVFVLVDVELGEVFYLVFCEFGYGVLFVDVFDVLEEFIVFVVSCLLCDECRVSVVEMDFVGGRWCVVFLG